MRLSILGPKVDITVKVFKDFEDKISKVKSVEFFKANKRDVFLEGWLVEKEDYLLDVFRSDVFLLH